LEKFQQCNANVQHKNGDFIETEDETNFKEKLQVQEKAPTSFPFATKKTVPAKQTQAVRCLI